MITPEQIRGARALLDWSTSRLAKLTFMTTNGINKIERGHVSAQRDTLEKIKTIFEAHGIEFLPGSGLRWRDSMVTVFEGKEFRRNQIKFWYEAMKDTGGPLSIAHENETEAIKDSGYAFLMEELRKRWSVGISHRVLVRADDDGLIPPYHTYHVLPDQYFSPYPLEIGGGHVAFSSRKYAPRAITIHNQRIAASLQKIFNFVYDHTPMVEKGKQELEQEKTSHIKKDGKV